LRVISKVWRMSRAVIKDSERVRGGDEHFKVLSSIIVTFIYLCPLKMHLALLRPILMKFLPVTVI